MSSSRSLPRSGRSDCAFATLLTLFPRGCTVLSGAMLEGWSKNLALLFGNSLFLAAWRVLDLILLIGLPLLAWRYWSYPVAYVPWITAGWLLALVWLRSLWRYYARVAKSNFPAGRLPHLAARFTAVCLAALPQLVSQPNFAPGHLEGTQLQDLIDSLRQLSWSSILSL